MSAFSRPQYALPGRTAFYLKEGVISEFMPRFIRRQGISGEIANAFANAHIRKCPDTAAAPIVYAIINWLIRPGWRMVITLGFQIIYKLRQMLGPDTPRFIVPGVTIRPCESGSMVGVPPSMVVPVIWHRNFMTIRHWLSSRFRPTDPRHQGGSRRCDVWQLAVLLLAQTQTKMGQFPGDSRHRQA